MTTSLPTHEQVQTLQRKGWQTAKRQPTYRFHALNKLQRPDIAAHAYALARDNDGAPGVDGRRLEDIESAGREQFVAELGEELRGKRYA